MKMMRLNSERWKRKELSCSGGVFIYLMSEKKYCKTNYVLVIMPYKYHQFFFAKKKNRKKEKGETGYQSQHHTPSILLHVLCLVIFFIHAKPSKNSI